MTDSDSKESSKPSSSTPRRALAGLNPMGLMDAAITEDNHQEWQPPEAAELEGQIDGYEGFSFIDRGGMGAVYAATQRSLSRRVAIKVLPSELSENENFVRLFAREGQMLGQLQHPHIVTVYESGRTRGGHLYLVMEYVEGDTLLEFLRTHSIGVTRALEITAQVCEALTYAHGRGVIHLDIKPGNILIDERGLVRVADFGLSRNFEKTGTTTDEGRRTRGFIGTVGYAAPEQRIPDAKVDHRTDIFSLGVTLYEMLTRMLPVGVFDPPSKKVGTPGHVDKIVLRAMRESPEDRYQSAAEMRSSIANSMLRLGTPLIQRAIISRPMVSMVTCVMVGMGLIYLLDGLNRLTMPRSKSIQSKPSPAIEVMESPDAASQSDMTLLDEDWAIIRAFRRSDQLEFLLKNHPDWQIAEIYSDDDQKRAMSLLNKHGFTRPLSLGAISDDQHEGGFRWLSGAPMTYQHWVPARSGSPLIITELQAKNTHTLKTKSGQTPDWIEIHNPGPASVDLTGYHLRHYYSVQPRGSAVVSTWFDHSNVPESQSMVLQPGEYRVICCNPRLTLADGYTRINISLEGSAGRLEWFDPQGVMIQKFSPGWSNFPDDASLGQAPSGTEWGWCQTPTPGRANTTLTSPFPAPTNVSLAHEKIIMLPEFGGLWARSPWYVSNHTLLRRVKK